MTTEERKKCTFCKVNLLFNEFKPKRNGTLTKRCIRCLDYNNKWQQKNKCEHNKRRSQCKECGGSSICKHNKRKSTCKECGGSSICIHDKRKSRCKECGGSFICQHNRQKATCKECDPQGHLAHIVSSRIQSALHSDKEKHSIEYLGCSIQHFKEHIEKQFTKGMTWDNYGEWQIDHIIPLKYENPTIEETIERLHWENTQPLWATDNIAKGNRYIG